MRLLTLPHFTAGEAGLIALAVHNRGHGQAQEVRVRLGGVLTDCLTFVLEPLLPRQEVELRAHITPTGPGNLRIETRYRDEGGHTFYEMALERDLEVASAERPITVQGEIGALTVRYKEGTSPPRVRVEGAVREVRYEAV